MEFAILTCALAAVDVTLITYWTNGRNSSGLLSGSCKNFNLSISFPNFALRQNDRLLVPGFRRTLNFAQELHARRLIWPFPASSQLAERRNIERLARVCQRLARDVKGSLVYVRGSGFEPRCEPYN